MIAKRDNPKRFEFFCVHELSAPTLCKLVGVRMVWDYGNHSYQDFRQWSDFPFSPCYSLMTETQDTRPKAHFPRWIWHAAPMKEFKRYAENCFVDHRMTAFSCWAPFPPGYVNFETFYEIFFDWWTRYVASEPKAYELIPDTPKHRYVVMVADAYAIADERSILNYHVAGYFPIKDEVPLSYVRLAFIGPIIYHLLVKWIGGLRKCLGYRGNRARKDHRELPKYPCVYCGKKSLMGMDMCMEFSRGIFYPTCLSLFRSSHPVDPVGAKKPPWLVTAMQQPNPEKVWGIVADSEVERPRNATIARSVVEDHRKVACFGGLVIKTVDFNLADAVKRKFRENVRGPMMGAIRFDISIERLAAAVSGPKSTTSVGQFFEANEHFRRYYASLFLNCREKPLCWKQAA